MPGVIVTTDTVTGPTGTRSPGGTYFVVGQAERGPTDRAVRVRGIADVERTFGGRTTYGTLYDDLRTYFAEGGERAYVARVVGPAATEGILELMDRGGVPEPTLELTARGAGTWSTGVTVTVVDGTIADTVTLTVDGPDGTERYRDVATLEDLEQAINDRSTMVTATTLGSTNPHPDNLPAAIAETALSAGDDDRAAITTDELAAGLDRFGRDLGAGAVAMPGIDAAVAHPSLAAHARLNDRIALLAPSEGTTPAEAGGIADGLLGQAGGEQVGMFYPWVRIPAGGARTKLVSPEGFVAGRRARAHATDGPWRAPAGQLAGGADFVLGTELDVDQAAGDTLDDAHVSAIRSIAGRPTLYGWRSLSTDEGNYALLTGRDALNVLTAQAREALEPLVFRPIDGRGRLFAEAEGILTGLVEPWRVAGGVYERTTEDGVQVDPGYRVDVGPSVNTPASIAAGRIVAKLAVRISPTGTLVEVTIVKVAVTAAV